MQDLYGEQSRHFASDVVPRVVLSVLSILS